ncbi:MAG: hypothetical protein IKH86_06770 [Prevotella sp.]|nr:hypothetical protein [Prevotella sp.]
MTTKIVYVLVSEETDYYYEMVMLSHYTLRLYHPKDTVEIVMDKATHQRLVEKKAAILNDVTPIVVSIPPQYTKIQRSRYLKTRLRHIVSGDFLYIDLDTFICESLEDIDNIKGTIGIVLENHGYANHHEDQYYPKEWEHLLKAKHFNGGVLYVKDKEEAKVFFEQWHNNWLFCLKNGCVFDQPGLRKTVSESDVLVEKLNGVWNCQISRETSQEYEPKAKILHYQRNAFLLTICKKIRKSGKIKGEIEEWAKSPRNAFSRNRTYISQAEFQALEPMRFMLNNYPFAYSKLITISYMHRYIIKSLTKIKRFFL